MSGQSWTVIVNPVAGRGRTRKLLPAIEERAASVGAKVEVSLTPDDPARLAHAAAAEGHDLVACGGDGVVGVVAGVAADTGRTLAIIPTGAGNDFARTLGYDPKHPLDAFGVLARGDDRVVDLGRVNGRWYTCVTASGFDAEANRWANTVTRLTGTPLYVAAVLRTLAVYQPHPFRLTVDGEEHEVRAWLVAVGNGPAYAGGMKITPKASMDDGVLDVTVVGELTRMQFLANFPKVFKGTHLAHPDIAIFRGTHVEIASLDPSIPMDVYADGERVGPLPATMEAVRQALRVRIPAGQAG
jgi:diacylglycerol kinase (ATP)